MACEPRKAITFSSSILYQSRVMLSRLLKAEKSRPTSKVCLVSHFRSGLSLLWMAKVVAAEAGRGDGVVLLAGNGHVRRDLGVPRWLEGTAGARAFSVGFVEEPAEGTFDERVAIVPHPRVDPCAK